MIFDLPGMARAIWVKHLSSLNETFRAARVQAPFTRDSRFEYESIGPRVDGVPDSSRIAQKIKGYVSWIAFKSYMPEGQMLQNRRRKIRLKFLHLVFLRSKKIISSKKIHIISFKLKINRYIIPEYCNKCLSWNICQKHLTNYFFNYQRHCIGSNILLDHKFVSSINV